MLVTARAPASASLRNLAITATPGDDQQMRADVNRLLYRSRQRGWLELDLLMGMWAEQNVPTMTAKQLEDYNVVLDEENPDLFKWLTNQLPTPEHLRNNSAYQLLHASVQQSMDKHSVVSTRATQGKDWVKGWDDNKKGELTAEQK
ncbi:SDHAF2 [Auxenochlorella protothecoides x Auxenochlorella symbiontica]